MFQSRQINDIYNLVEVSFVNFTLTSTTGGTTTTQTGIAPTLGAPGSNAPATFQAGDIIELYPSAAVGPLAALLLGAYPSAQGILTIAILNRSAATVTPSAGVWTVVAKRVAANTF
jgi:hypothetical protein